MLYIPCTTATNTGNGSLAKDLGGGLQSGNKHIQADVRLPATSKGISNHTSFWYMWQLIIEIKSYAHILENEIFAQMRRRTPISVAHQVLEAKPFPGRRYAPYK